MANKNKNLNFCFVFLSIYTIFALDMEQKKILVVDDERDLCEILTFNLKTAGYETMTACSAEEALTVLDDKHFDLILLDVMMEGMTGFELAKQLGRRIPIIFLTAKDTEDDMLTGFGLGADDYIAKPFSVREVLARVKAVLSRTAADHSDILTYKGLMLDLNNKRVQADGEDIQLTRTEFELLALLFSDRGHVFTRQELIDRVWPKNVVITDRTVDVNITRLRKKIGSYASVIATRQGYGYCFDMK